MEDRYEIRGKIGQGGLGSVYRGYDNRMNREVAIKRIMTVSDDPALQEESTRQLVKEAGALASLQHPNIVTIHDVGGDEEGPYVVMELITGNTLDELIERAPLTWPDFKELALQTQEALIAAHELNLIHSDLKPSNLMLTWLPSGKFQIKIVDFGLATLAQSQSKEDLESIEAVFGSIFFMPPEQFERTPLDVRSDLYSLGCVYYQALTGIYPFDGQTGNEVMNSHLSHTVKPLKEVRAGIPVWACDWIMWLINRYPQDRPESAREALSLFLQNDRIANQPMSLGIPKPVTAAPRPRVLGQTGEHPLSGPPTQSIAKAKMVKTTQVATLAAEAAVGTQTAPQALAPPEGFKPSVHTSAQDSNDSHHGHAAGRTRRMHHAEPVEKPPFKLGKNAKIGIAAAGLVLLLIFGVFLMKMNREKGKERVITEILAQAGSPATSEVKITGPNLRIILESAIATESNTKLQDIGKALAKAKATDGTDVDDRIATFATKNPDLSLRAREILISEVLRIRNNPVIMPAMLEFAASSDDPELVVAALQSIRQMAGDAQFDGFLKIIESTNNNQIRDAAEENIVEIIRKNPNPGDIAKQLKSAHESNIKPDIQRTLQRLLSLCDSVKPSGK